MTPHHARKWQRVAGTAALALLLAGIMPACKRGDDVASLMAQAAQYRQKGQLKAAVIELKNVLQKDADNRAARQQLGELYIALGDGPSADNELRRALGLGGNAAVLGILLGKALLMQGQYERILDQKVPDGTARQRASFMALRANAALGLGKNDAAKAQLEQALALDPACADALLAQARLAMNAQQTGAALDLISRALAADPAHIDSLRLQGDLLRTQGKADAALSSYRQILAHSPGDAQAHIDIANVHIDAAQFKLAHAEIDEARRANPGLLSVFYASALLDFREGKYSAALDGLQQILRAAPGHLPSILLSGAVQLALASPQQAEQHLHRFLESVPHHLYASKLMASAQLEQARPEAAIAVLTPLMRENSGDVELMALAGEANMRARHFTIASELFEKASALRPDAAMLHTALALSRLGTGDTARAVGELERASTLEKPSVRTGVLLVMAYLRSNATDKALAAVEKMEKEGNNPLVQNLKGGVYLARQDLAQARACFGRALALDPRYMPALDNLAQIDVLEKKPEQARQRYGAALAKDPKNAALMEALARLATREGKTAQALAWLEKSYAEHPDSLASGLRMADFYLRAGETAKALTLSQKLQAANPANGDAIGALARAQAASGNRAAALDNYAKLSVLYPKSAAPHMLAANNQIAMGDLKGALASLGKALAIEPDLLEAQMKELGLLLMQKRFSEAQAVVATIQKQRAGSAIGDKLEGDLMLAQEKPVPALKAYERAFSKEKSAPVLTQIAAALSKAGKSGEADARIKLWLDDHRDDIATRLYFASAKLVRQELDEAIEQFSLVLKQDPQNVMALNDIACAYQQRHDARALAFAERALKLAANNPSVLDTLGWIYEDSGNSARALPLLQKALALAPDSPDIGYHLGVTLAKAGDKLGARKHFEHVLAAGKDFPQREHIKAMLATL
jgi:cellulose synthase operon protein C